MADRVTIADVAADADRRLGDVFGPPRWHVRPGGPPDRPDAGHVWTEIRGATPARTPARAEQVALRYVAVVAAQTAAPEYAAQLDALDRFVALAAAWPAAAGHVLTVQALDVGGVDTPAVVAELTVICSPC